MAIAYYGASISPHMDRTPEGYLICRDVPINRTGTQPYTAGELGMDGDPDREVTVYRLPEDVFAPAAMASFEGKDITRGHPPEMLSAENQAGYSKGHLEHVRRQGEPLGISPRRGRFGSGTDVVIGAGISIHAPARGATFLARMRAISCPVFQSAPPRGGRLHRDYWA